MVAAVAIPWFVLVTTGSPARTGVAAFFTTAPLALGAFFGGAVADRVGARRASVAGDVVSALALAAIPVLHAGDALEFWHVLVLGFVGALFDAPAQAAREALLPELAERARMPLERANALWASTEHTGYVLGAPAAGLLIAAFGAPTALWLDAGSFVLSALVVAAVPALPGPRIAKRRYIRDLVDGLRFIARNGVLVTFLVIATIGNLLISPLASVILPVYANERFGSPTSLAAMTTAYGAGGLLGAALFAAVGTRVTRRKLFVAFWVAYPLVSLALVPVPALGLLMAILFGIGLLAGGTGPLEQAVRQTETPPELRGRVFATFMASLTLAIPIGVLSAGFLIQAAGLQAALVAFAAGNALLALGALTARAARDI